MRIAAAVAATLIMAILVHRSWRLAWSRYRVEEAAMALAMDEANS